jgi:DNA-binding CsgD family transcriptional regulator
VPEIGTAGTTPALGPSRREAGDYDADMGGRIGSPIVVGRRSELATLRAAIAAHASDIGPIILVAGEAGIGKSRLLAELAVSVSDEPPRGRPVIAAGSACLALVAGELPFAPIIELLDRLAQKVDGDVSDEARGLADELSSPTVPSTADGPSQTIDRRRPQRFRRLVALIDRIQAGRDVLLVVDDLQWADPSTLDVLAYLAHRLHGERPVIVLAYRSDEVHRRHPIRPWLGLMRRRSVRYELDLGPLDEAAVEAQITAILGHSPSFELLRSVIERADGNPLFVEELVALGPTSALPETLRDALAARIRPLDAETHQALAVAALIGRDVRRDDLADLTGLEPDELEPALRAIVDARLLEPTADRQGFRFRHALVLEAMTDELTPGEGRRLHRRIAERLEASAQPADPSELAHHWLEAGVPAAAMSASAEAAARAEARGGWAEAASALERVLTLWDQVEPADRPGLDRGTLLGRAGRAIYLAGEPRRALGVLSEAIAVTESEGPRDDLVELCLFAAYVATDLGDPVASDHVRRALELTADTEGPERVRALAYDASYQQVTGRFRAAIERATATLDLARMVDDPDAIAMASSALDLSNHSLGRPDEGDAAFAVARSAVSRSSDLISAWTVQSNHAAALQVAGRARAAFDLIEESLAAIRGTGAEVSIAPWLETGAAESHWWLGQWDACDEALGRADRWGLEGRILTEHEWIAGRLAAWRGHALSATEALTAADLSIADGEDPWERATSAAERADAASWAGDPAIALAAAQAGLAALEGSDELPGRARLAWLAARSVADLTVASPRSSARGPAQELEGLVRAMRDGTLVPGGRPPAQAAALLALAEAELARAIGASRPAAWEASAETLAELGYRPLEAYGRFRLGEARLAAGDRDGASADLRAAREIAVDLAAAPLVARIDDLAHRSRIDLGPGTGHELGRPTPSDRSPDRWALSDREREVLGLVALGWTNRRIGEALFITEKTASHHVTHILDKLGVWSRTEAAVMAAQAGIVAPRAND